MLANYCLTGFIIIQHSFHLQMLFIILKSDPVIMKPAAIFTVMFRRTWRVPFDIIFFIKTTRCTTLFCQDTIFVVCRFRCFAVICAVNNCIWNHMWKSLPDYLWNSWKKSKSFGYVGRERKKACRRIPTRWRKILFPSCVNFFFFLHLAEFT